MLRYVVRAIIAVPLLAGGVGLLYSAWWLVANGVWPEWRKNRSLSLTGDALVLNHRWEGNELYLLIAVYVTLGLALVAGGVALLGALRWFRRANKGS